MPKKKRQSKPASGKTKSKPKAAPRGHEFGYVARPTFRRTAVSKAEAEKAAAYILDHLSKKPASTLAIKDVEAATMRAVSPASSALTAVLDAKPSPFRKPPVPPAPAKRATPGGQRWDYENETRPSRQRLFPALARWLGRVLVY